MPEKCKAPDFYLKSALYTFKKTAYFFKNNQNKQLYLHYFLDFIVGDNSTFRQTNNQIIDSSIPL
jgi:hypothetical protein